MEKKNINTISSRDKKAQEVEIERAPVEQEVNVEEESIQELRAQKTRAESLVNAEIKSYEDWQDCYATVRPLESVTPINQSETETFVSSLEQQIDSALRGSNYVVLASDLLGKTKNVQKFYSEMESRLTGEITLLNNSLLEIKNEEKLIKAKNLILRAMSYLRLQDLENKRTEIENKLQEKILEQQECRNQIDKLVRGAFNVEYKTKQKIDTDERQILSDAHSKVMDSVKIFQEQICSNEKLKYEAIRGEALDYIIRGFQDYIYFIPNDRWGEYKILLRDSLQIEFTDEGGLLLAAPEFLAKLPEERREAFERELKNSGRHILGGFNLRPIAELVTAKMFSQKILKPREGYFNTDFDYDSSRFMQSYATTITDWQRVHSFDSIQKVFAQEAVAIDKDFERVLVKESLDDFSGETIDALEYYPTPEAIRNLVLLLSADNKGYSKSHATGTFEKIIKQPVWPKIREATLAVYPELNLDDVVEVVSNKSPIYYSILRRPRIGRFASEIFKQNLTESGKNTRISELALQSMSVADLAELAIERGILNEGSATAIIKAQKKIDESFPDQDVENLHIRRMLIDFISHNKNDNERMHLAQIEKVVELANAVSNNEIKSGEEQSLSFSYFQAENFQKAYAMASPENAKKLLEVPGQLPRLMMRPDLIPGEAFFQNFEGQKTIDIFKKLEESYRGEDDCFYNILDFIHRGIMKVEWATKLPTIIPEIVQNKEYWNIVRAHPDIMLADSDSLEFAGLFIEGSKVCSLEARNNIMNLVGNRAISPARSLVLLKEFKFEDPSEEMLNHPNILLQNNAGLKFARSFQAEGINCLDEKSDQEFGAAISMSKNDGNAHLFGRFIKALTRNCNKNCEKYTEGEISSKNWFERFILFIKMTLEDGGLSKMPEEVMIKIKAEFERAETKQLCLDELRSAWQGYLNNGEMQTTPGFLQITSTFISENGAGPMSQLEGQGEFINSFINFQEKRTSTVKSKNAVFTGLGAMENRFSAERWANDERTSFYQISKDILEASPALFSDYLKLFQELKPIDLKSFAEELYPLHRAKLVLLEKNKNIVGSKHQLRDLVSIRRDINELIKKYSTANSKQETVDLFEVKHMELVGEITELFKNRFGIIKIPAEFSPEIIKSLVNASTYLANLNDRDVEKENTLGFYLSLMINNQWQAFRGGQTVAPGEYLMSDRVLGIEQLLKKREELSPLTTENLHISEAQLPDFIHDLQAETQNQALGEVETIDSKLTNVIANLQGLSDQDLYAYNLDKVRVKLLTDYGNKKIGGVVAGVFQKIKKDGWKITDLENDTSMGAEDKKIIAIIRDGLKLEGLEFEIGNLKKHFQDELKQFSVSTNLLDYVKEMRAEEEVATLQQLLSPSPEVVSVFNSLGESFSVNSGAVAMSKDLGYLESLLTKAKDRLMKTYKKSSASSGEIENRERQTKSLQVATEYIKTIGDQLGKLELIYEQIKGKASSLEQVSKNTTNELLKAKLIEIKAIIERRDDQQIIVSTITTDLGVVMENIRECLSCVRQGCNNDTNLSFGDSNKFFIISQTDVMQKGSISDQIIYLEPAELSNGNKTMALVMDKVYGVKTAGVFLNHFAVLLKKYEVLKNKYQDLNMSIVIPDEVIKMDKQLLIDKIKHKFGSKLLIDIESLTINLIPSATGDHYEEFAESARLSGQKKVNGLVIRV
jgi:hypothetical protein